LVVVLNGGQGSAEGKETGSEGRKRKGRRRDAARKRWLERAIPHSTCLSIKY
jgi:hypothetical protein